MELIVFLEAQYKTAIPQHQVRSGFFFLADPYFVVEDSKTIQARMMVDVCMKFGVWKRLGEQFVNLLYFES